MSHSPTHTATPIAPLSLPHRVLRAVQHRELGFVALREAVAADGLAASTCITFCISATAQLIGDELLTKDGLLYGLSPQGQAALADLELLATKAMQDQAKPAQPKVIAPPPVFDPHAGSLAARGGNRQTMSHTERRPPSLRPGSQDALACPSRMGNHLHHRDGRVTDLQGKPA